MTTTKERKAPTEDMLGVTQMGELFGLDRNATKQRVRLGYSPTPIRINGRVYFRIADIRAYLAKEAEAAEEKARRRREAIARIDAMQDGEKA